MFTKTLFSKERLVIENQFVRLRAGGGVVRPLRVALVSLASLLVASLSASSAALFVCVPSGV
jgi:hypothetical protein